MQEMNENAPLQTLPPLAPGKVLSELLQPLEDRIASVLQFVSDVAPSLQHRVVPISDPYGPTITEPDMDCLVVSRETLRGGEASNQLRVAKVKGGEASNQLRVAKVKEGRVMILL